MSSRFDRLACDKAFLGSSGSKLWLPLFIASLLDLTIAIGASGGAQSPFGVKDSIAWTTALPFSWLAQTTRPSDIALFSPDRTHFVIRTRRGDLARNANIDSLLLYRTREVEEYAGARSMAVPEPIVLLEVPDSTNAEATSSIRWMNDSEVSFLAKGANGYVQAFVVQIASGVQTQLTFSDTDVVSYIYVGETILYYARIKQASERPLVVVLGEQSLGSWWLRDLEANDSTPMELFMGTRGRSGVEKLPLPAMRLTHFLTQIWISPSGDNAIVLAPAVNAPLHWQDYRVPDPVRWGFGPEWIRSDATSLDLTNRARYFVIDLRLRTVRPLLDAPSGVISFNMTPPAVFWRRNGRSVVVSNTYLPLQGVELEQRQERVMRPAIAEIDLDTGQTTPIAWESVRPSLKDRAEFVILAIGWNPRDERLTINKRRIADGVISSEAYRATETVWTKETPDAIGQVPNSFSVEINQDLNTRPKIFVTLRSPEQAPPSGPSCNRSMTLLDLNPQAEKLKFGTVQETRWKDLSGIEWMGGVLFPVDYIAGRRYPLVVQTHGFDPLKFLLDGPADGQGGTAFAAQAFANAGFFVLLVPDQREAITRDSREGELAAEGFRSGIEHLVSKGVVDPSKVGLIAFSRTGYHVLHLIARHPKILAAVSISDSLQAGYWNYLLTVNGGASAIEIENLTGGAPDVTNPNEWFARNPLYNLSHTTVAVRLEEMGPYAGLGFWETYAVLRAGTSPVDFILFPQGSHVLQKPIERLASQGGNVDWFRFWLKDEEDTDSTKAEQYVRWRKLKLDGSRKRGSRTRDETDRGSDR